MNIRLLSSSSIAGTDVKNLVGENLGEVKELMINTNTGKVEYAVLSFGGFLGMGDKYFAVPWNAFNVDRVEEELILDASKERLENAPGFDKDNWPSTASPYFKSVSDYYGRSAVL